MKLLLNNRNLILAIGNNIEFGFYEDTEKWNVDNAYHFIDGDYHVEEIEEVPANIIADKYFYINNEYVLNENYYNERKDIQGLEQQITDLQLALAELFESLEV